MHGVDLVDVSLERLLDLQPDLRHIAQVPTLLRQLCVYRLLLEGLEKRYQSRSTAGR